MADCWAVAVTWPNYERRVERALQQNGFEVYLPRLRNPRTLLFPRYVFAAPDHSARRDHSEIRKVYGVSKLLRSDDEQPALVPDDQLLHIRQHEDKDGFIQLPSKPRFRRGQRVRITLGALTGQVGTYQGLKRRNVELVRLALGTVSVPYGNLVCAEV
jgi:transcription antitermination factor NusG